MPETIWVVGGQQHGTPHWTKEWKLYKKGMVVAITKGRVTSALEYQSPPEHCPSDSPSIVFKAATIVGNRAYLCTQTEVLVCHFPSFRIDNVISLPCFNDVHHVAVAPDGRLFVAVTGLDAVAELAPDGTLLRLDSVIDDSPWDRFSPTTDYRKIATTKPHHAHPNYVFFIDDEPWVTRFQQRDAVPLDRTSRKRPSFKLGEEGVHDGHVSGNYLYFTAVDGRIVRFDLRSDEMRSYDLNAIGSIHEQPLGWCRGIIPLDDTVLIGFSRIRFSNLRQNLDWVRRGFKEVDRYPPAPTRIAEYDLDRHRLLREINLEDAGMNTVFSIHRFVNA